MERDPLGQDLREIRGKLINIAIVTAGIYALFGLISSLMRYFAIGWHPIFIGHFIIAASFVFLAFFRNKLPLFLKTHLFFANILVVALLGIINFKIASGTYWFFGIISIATTLYGINIGLIYLAIFTTLYILVAYLHHLKILCPTVDFNLYLNYTTTWGAHLFGLVFLSIIVAQTINLFFRYFKETLEQSKRNEKNLEQALAALQVSERKYRSLFEGSIDAILIVDREFNITDCNQSYLNLVGYERSELVGKKYDYGLPNKNIDWDAFFVELSKKTERKSIEIETMHKDGYLIPIEVTPYVMEEDNEMYLWGVIRDLREVKALEKEVFSSMVNAEEKERERYAKELHDGLGPLLSTALIYINAVGDEKEEATIKEFSQRSYDIIKEATSVIREISNNLSPIILSEYGLAQAVRSFIEKAQFATNIKFSISDKKPQRFESTIEFTLYRVLVELTNNSIKYSKATQVKITFINENPIYIIVFEDDGAGFDYQKAIATNRGFGLLNLETRITKIGGKYQYTTEPGRGVTVTITLKNVGI